MKIKKFSDINESVKISFGEAFDTYIKGQIIEGHYSVNPYGDYNLPPEERYYGDGVILKNGYKFIQHGGGCSGEDCNTTFIIDDNDILVATNNW